MYYIWILVKLIGGEPIATLSDTILLSGSFCFRFEFLTLEMVEFRYNV